MKISEIAQHSGLPTSTLRYYERLGLIPAPQRVSGQRAYDRDVLQTIKIIQVMQQMGFTLREIRQMRSDHPLDSWRSAAPKKLAEIELMIEEFQTMRNTLLEGLACQCSDMESCTLFQ